MNKTVVIVGLAAAAAAYLIAEAGSLEPPGPPAPTMKTLTDIEPRIPIDTSTNISDPGSYYLTQSLVAHTPIVISASDVSLDLNGFSLTATGTFSPGLEIADDVTNVIVENGSVVSGNFTGVSINAVSNVHVRRLRISGNSDNGIWVSAQGAFEEVVAHLFIDDCTIVDNGNYGISLTVHQGASFYLRNNVVSGNGNSGIAINGTTGSPYSGTLRGNRVFGNGNHGIWFPTGVAENFEITGNVSGHHLFGLDYVAVQNVSTAADAGPWHNIAMPSPLPTQQ